MKTDIIEVQNKDINEMCVIINNWLENHAVKNLTMSRMSIDGESIDGEDKKRSYYYWKGSLKEIKIHRWPKYKVQQLNFVLQGISQASKIKIPEDIKMRMSLLSISCS